MPHTVKQLIAEALKVANPQQLSSSAMAGSVGCALITDKGTLFTGVNIDTKCSLGFCAEGNAIGSMVTAGEQNISMIVAIKKTNDFRSPCGRCREFMRQVSDYNMENTQVILNHTTIKTLKDLLPE